MSKQSIYLSKHLRTEYSVVYYVKYWMKVALTTLCCPILMIYGQEISCLSM